MHDFPIRTILLAYTWFIYRRCGFDETECISSFENLIPWIGTSIGISAVKITHTHSSGVMRYRINRISLYVFSQRQTTVVLDNLPRPYHLILFSLLLCLTAKRSSC